MGGSKRVMQPDKNAQILPRLPYGFGNRINSFVLS